MLSGIIKIIIEEDLKNRKLYEPKIAEIKVETYHSTIKFEDVNTHSPSQPLIKPRHKLSKDIGILKDTMNHHDIIIANIKYILFSSVHAHDIFTKIVHRPIKQV